MTTRVPSVPKAEVLARYQESSQEPEEHRKMMSSKDTWENRFEEAAALISWSRVATWLDVGCGTARFFEKVIDAGCAVGLRECVGVDVVENNLRVGKDKHWPDRPRVQLVLKDIECLDELEYGSFDLVTMVGVVYQCGLPPAVAIEQCLGRLAPNGVFLVTSENVRFDGFRADPHGCYPSRIEFEAMLDRRGSAPDGLTVQYTNPLWRQRSLTIADSQSEAYKEAFFLASYTAPPQP